MDIEHFLTDISAKPMGDYYVIPTCYGKETGIELFFKKIEIDLSITSDPKIGKTMTREEGIPMNHHVYFSIENEHASINFTVTDYKTVGEDDWEEELYYERITDDLECYYNYRMEDGWGSVEDTVSIADITVFSQLFQSLANGTINEFEFMPQNELFVCRVKHAEDGYTVDFKIRDGLEDSWVQVTKEGVSKSDVDTMAQAVSTWSENFPAVDEENAIICCEKL